MGVDNLIFAVLLSPPQEGGGTKFAQGRAKKMYALRARFHFFGPICWSAKNAIFLRLSRHSPISNLDVIFQSCKMLLHILLAAGILFKPLIKSKPII